MHSSDRLRRGSLAKITAGARTVLAEVAPCARVAKSNHLPSTWNCTLLRDARDVGVSSTTSDAEFVSRTSLQQDTIKDYRGYSLFISLLVSRVCTVQGVRPVSRRVQQHTDSGTIVDPVEAGSSKRATNNGA